MKSPFYLYTAVPSFATTVIAIILAAKNASKTTKANYFSLQPVAQLVTGFFDWADLTWSIPIFRASFNIYVYNLARSGIKPLHILLNSSPSSLRAVSSFLTVFSRMFNKVELHCWRRYSNAEWSCCLINFTRYASFDFIWQNWIKTQGFTLHQQGTEF